MNVNTREALGRGEVTIRFEAGHEWPNWSREMQKPKPDNLMSPKPDDELPPVKRKNWMRNKPCPCGSKRKFKKCCWNREGVDK